MTKVDEAQAIWTPWDSRSDMLSRLERVRTRVAPEIVSDEASSWGYLTVDELTIPLGYVFVGIPPSVVLYEGVIVLGITDIVVALRHNSGHEIFRYELGLGTVFHQFLTVDSRGLLIQEEIGFVWLTWEGEKRWSYYLDDIVGAFTISDGRITGKTFEGKPFEVTIPGYE